MQKCRALLLCFLIVFFVSCGPEKREAVLKTGVTDQPVQLEVRSEDITDNEMVEWSFARLPPRVILTKYDFQPVHSSPQVSFVPPDTGTYQLNYTILHENGQEQLIQPFIVRVTDSLTVAGAADSAQVATTSPSAPSEDRAGSALRGTPGPTAPADRSGRSTTTQGNVPAEIPRQSDRYTVQVSSFRMFSDAETAASQLRELGYDPYIQRAEVPGNNQVWYRVRIGSFRTYEAAQTLAGKLQREPLLRAREIWIDYQREDT
ncbi:MAG TPA: SPOR domain-containing protein [bacterium]|nr:SPOR domain-containing protein [bacterium]